MAYLPRNGPVRGLAPLGLALALLFGSSGLALTADPARPATAMLPAVRSDPVQVQPPLTQGPAELAVRSDPVPMVPLSISTQTGFVLAETFGPGLVGTYVGSPGAVRYIPAFQYQLVYGDPLGGYNCTAYAMAMAIDKATYGGTLVTGRQVRALTGVTVSGSHIGLSIPDVLVASDKLKVSIVNMAGDWDGVMAALRVGRGVLLQGLYSAIPIEYSGQPGFVGAHAIYVDRISSTGRLYMMDPLQKIGPRWMDESVMRAFAEALSNRERTYPRVFYAVTRPTRLFR